MLTTKMLPKPPTSPRLIPATHCLSPTRNHPHKRSHIGRKKGYEKKKKEKKEEEEKEETGKIAGAIKVKVCEIVDPITFYAQIVDDKGHAQVEAAMKKFSESVGKALESQPKRSEVVAAPFEGGWYRARVEGKNAETGLLKVFFIDYGNYAEMPLSQLKALEQSVGNLQPLAQLCKLAAVRPPADKLGFAEEAAGALYDLVWDRELVATIETKDRDGRLHLSLHDAEGEPTINQQLLQQGWLRVDKKPLYSIKELADKFRADQQMAKNERLNIWQYSLDDDDEEEDKKPFAGKPKRA